VTAGRLLLAAALLGALALCGSDSSRSAGQPFVTRSGAKLVLGDRTFRFGGANVEWLGVAAYGPADPAGPHAPSNFEIDDALATVQLLGGTVVRSQTLGDSVGCVPCLEPSLGVFNKAAFERADYAIASARAHGIRVIPTIVGDDAEAGGSGCVYLRWRGIDVPNCSLINMAPFWTDSTVIGDVEAHIATLLNHVNVYTHLAWKNDPTILGWDLLNGGGSPRSWTRKLATYVHGIDKHHLVLSGYDNARIAGVDACVSFVYAHWSLPLAVVKPWIATCKRAGKPYIVYEYGWDRTNLPTQTSLRSFLATLRGMPNVAGDAFWALQSHAVGHGWQPIPANTDDPTVAAAGESGQWWALYYPGLRTLVNTAADMRARAEIIRANDYALRGLHVPAHPRPRAPAVTSAQPVETGIRVYWQGSPGAASYSVQRAGSASGPWSTICSRCATDADDGYVDAGAAGGSWYRVIPFNVDGKSGAASRALRAGA
jgi:mannan endo-1,4-beta-mannosidase